MTETRTDRSALPRLPGVWAAVVLACLSDPAWPGRPLTVDDAGTNAKGEGHIEAWGARAEGHRSLNLSPAYAFAEGLEVVVLLARDTTDRITTTDAQLKWLITPSKERGCNAGAAFRAARATGHGTSDSAFFVNGLFSCHAGPSHLHLNLGSAKMADASATATWGIAFERDAGAVTPHIEWFGAEGAKPTIQVGARGDVAKNLQLDGTLGRGDGQTLYSLGLKFKF